MPLLISVKHPRQVLERFKELVEKRQTESGAWRGEVHKRAVIDR